MCPPAPYIYADSKPTPLIIDPNTQCRESNQLKPRAKDNKPHFGDGTYAKKIAQYIQVRFVLLRLFVYIRVVYVDRASALD